VFCACEIVKLFSAAFCVVRAVHKFDFRLVINEKRKNGDRYTGHAVTETHVFDKIYMFSPSASSGGVKRRYPHTAGQLHSL
jgi:hypothetical protein